MTWAWAVTCVLAASSAGVVAQPVALDARDPAAGAHRAGLLGRVLDKRLKVRHADRDGNTAGVADHLSLRVRKGPEILEQWTDSNKAIVGTLAQNVLASQVSSITKDSYHQMQASFVNLVKSRFILNPGNEKAGHFIKDHLAHLGFEVRDEPVDIAYSTMHGRAPTGNIVGYWKGTDLSNELVVFGAHYDSVNWQDTSGAAPGADDNGSGVAALLVLAELIAKEAKQRPLRRSVAFVAFQAEEVGLMGSKQFVSGSMTKYGTPVAVLIADEISNPGRPQFLHKAIFETKGRELGNVALIDTLAHAASAESGVAGFEVNYHGFGSDHVPFLDAGYPAVLMIERDNMYFADTLGHTAQDTMEHTDPNFASAMTRLAARAVLTLASPATPNVSV